MWAVRRLRHDDLISQSVAWPSRRTSRSASASGSIDPSVNPNHVGSTKMNELRDRSHNTVSTQISDNMLWSRRLWIKNSFGRNSQRISTGEARDVCKRHNRVRMRAQRDRSNSCGGIFGTSIDALETSSACGVARSGKHRGSAPRICPDRRDLGPVVTDAQPNTLIGKLSSSL
jgi:hypothetical protein